MPKYTGDGEPTGDHHPGETSPEQELITSSFTFGEAAIEGESSSFTDPDVHETTMEREGITDDFMMEFLSNQDVELCDHNDQRNTTKTHEHRKHTIHSKLVTVTTLNCRQRR